MNKFVVGAALSVACAQIATASVWINEDGANTPETAHLWSASANWQDGAKPAGTSDLADFSQYGVAAGGLRFVRLDEPVTSYRIVTHADDTLCILGDGANEYTGAGGSSISGSSNGQSSLRLYATYLGSGGECNFANVDFCGKVWQSTIKENASGYTFRANGGQMRFRYDLYALQAGGERVNEGGTYCIQYAWGDNLEWIAPKGSDAGITATWTLVEKSPYARLAAGQDAHDLCAGTLVSAANGALPAGTFLKRIFADGLIELSNAATVGGETALTFAAITQKVYQYVDQLNDCIDKGGAFRFLSSKYREADDLRIEVRHAAFGRDQSKPENDRLRFSSSTGIPGTFVFHNVDGINSILELDNCHFELGGRFMDPAAGHSEIVNGGFKNIQAARFPSASSYARLTVTNNVTSAMRAITNIVGTLVKDGAGTLNTTFPNSYSPSGELNNTGSVIVEEGVLAVTNAGRNAVANLTLKAGATLRVKDVLAVTTFVPEEGAIVSGGGTLLLSAPMDLSGVVFEGGTSWAIAAPVKKNAGEVLNAVKTVPGVPTRVQPAFWLDARAADSFVYDDEETATVRRWNDCRATGTHFATNVASVFPKRETDKQGIVRGVRFLRQTATKDQIDLTDALVWDAPIENIKEVFVVVEWKGNAAAQFLGSTMSRLSGKGTFFQRWADSSTYAKGNNILSSGSAAFAAGWKCHLNGAATSLSSYDFYFGYNNSNGGHIGGSTAHTSETIVHTAPMCFAFNRNGGTDGWADCFSFGTFANNANGAEMISEVLVYTDDLTPVERRSIEQYLMHKWDIGDANADRFEFAADRVSTMAIDGDYPLTLDYGEYLPVDKVTGSGTLVKLGAGKLYVDDYVNAAGSIKVAAGELELRSVLASKETLPTNAYLHLDACQIDSFVKDEVDVSSWADWRGEGRPVATKHTGTATTYPQFVGDAVGAGLNVVDFGVCFKDGTGPQMNFTAGAPNGIRSGFWLVGTQNGGGSFMGGCQSGSTSYAADGGITRAYSPDYEVPLSAGLYWSSTSRPILHNWLQGKQTVYTRINGAQIASGTASNLLSGGYDVVSMSTPDYYHVDAISRTHYGSRGGGFSLGEQIYYERRLSFEEVDLVDAYLNNKWKGVALPDGFRGAEAASVEVADGATLTIVGNAPLKVASLSGAGTVKGVVELTDGGSFVVPVATDGSTGTLTLDAIDLSKAAELHFAGSVRKLTAGEHVLVSAPTIKAGDSVVWTVTGLSNNRTCVLKTVDGALIADVSKMGSAIIIR